jgi:hypothetical protein
MRSLQWLSLFVVGVLEVGAKSDSPLLTVVSAKAQLRDILHDTTPWLVLFKEGSEHIVLPQGESDESETAWFAKLSTVWEDVASGQIPWASKSKTLIKFAVADITTLTSQGASELFDSESSDLMEGLRLLVRGRDQGKVRPQKMTSRKLMHSAITWLDLKLSKLKEEL